jgi:heme-degrading monooxygenase HmoA
MYARLTLLEIDTLRVSVDGAVELFREAILPDLQKQPGYAGVLVLSTPQGVGALLSFWESAEAADAGASTGWYPEVLEKYMTMFKSPPGRERYEVAFAELPAGASG